MELARRIIASVPPFVTITGLFVNALRSEVEEIQDQLDLLQFHGDEDNQACSGYRRPVIKALRMRPDVDLEELLPKYQGLRGFLLDAYRKGVPGGTGETFDWQRIPEKVRPQIVLAGGLNPENVDEAIRVVRPYAVDVSGGVEAEPGRKSADKIIHFMKGVRHADSTDH